MKKTYTEKDFTINTYNQDAIMTEENLIKKDSAGNLVTESYFPSILSVLIGEAGRYCENHSSDIFVMWNSVLHRMIEHPEETVYLFGFRQNGVDNMFEILLKCNDNCYIGVHEYRSIWRMELTREQETIGTVVTAKLGRVR